MVENNKLIWTTSDVQDTKQRVRENLNELFPNGNNSQRIAYILSQLSFKYDEQHVNFLEKTIYCISALYHHARFGGLKRDQVRKIENLTLDLLKFLKIKPITSKLSFLYGELFLVRSQIDRQEGEHWKSAWQQQLASYFTGQKSKDLGGIEDMSLAIRMLRLGRVFHAINYYQSALSSEDLTPSNRKKVYLGLSKCYRYNADKEAALSILNKLKTDGDLTNEQNDEVVWEETCWALISDGSPKELIKLTKPKNTHHSSIYILEMYLWVYASREIRYVKKLPSINYLKQKSELKLRDQNFLLLAVETLISSYDTDFSLPVRLKDLSEIITRGNEFLSLEQQLLFILAVTRFLIRSKLNSMAEFCAIEYSKITTYKTKTISDPIGIADDILVKFNL